MQGLMLSERYYFAHGKPALEAAFPALLPRLAVGLVGEGSECFGFDDEQSRDHDFGPGFCLWLTKEDDIAYGAELRALYAALPGEFLGVPPRTEGALSAGRVGVLELSAFYRRLLGVSDAPEDERLWMQLEESMLATATNGRVFADPLGEFSAIRERLRYYPERVRRRKIARQLGRMSQAGQYNLARCLRRGDYAAAYLCTAECVKAAVSLVYLLNRRYMPFYKWAMRGLRELPLLPDVAPLLAQLMQAGYDDHTRPHLIEEMSDAIRAELYRQALSRVQDPFLIEHVAPMLRSLEV